MTSDEINIADVKDLDQAKEVIVFLLDENEALREKILRLEKNSKTSSKPPSSDFFSNAKSCESKGKKSGGKNSGKSGKGKATSKNPKPARFAAAAKVSEFKKLEIKFCPATGNTLHQEATITRFQTFELREDPVTIKEYELESRYCPDCLVYHQAPAPNGGRKFGPRLECLLSYLRSAPMSVSSLVDLCEEVFEFPACKSTIQASIDRVSSSLAPAHNEVISAVTDQKSIHVDETGWKLKGALVWAWVFCSTSLAAFVLRPSRSADVLKEVLGSIFSGAIHSDFFSAYVSYACEKQQFCLAHLIRDLLALGKCHNRKDSLFSSQVLEKFRQLIHLWHKRDIIDGLSYKRRVANLKTRLRNVLNQADPTTRDAKRLKKRILKYWDSLFRFLEHPELFAPTNNYAERTIRKLVCIRKLSFGSQSEKGLRWIERSMTVIQTLRIQRRPVFEFMLAALNSKYQGSKMPSLLKM